MDTTTARVTLSPEATEAIRRALRQITEAARAVWETMRDVLRELAERWAVARSELRTHPTRLSTPAGAVTLNQPILAAVGQFGIDTRSALLAANVRLATIRRTS